MKKNLIKCTVIISSDLVVECELTLKTIEELKTKNLVSVRKID